MQWNILMSTKNNWKWNYFTLLTLNYDQEIQHFLEKSTCSNKLNVEDTVTGSNLRQYRSNLRKSNLHCEQIVIVLHKLLSKFCQWVDGKFWRVKMLFFNNLFRQKTSWHKVSSCIKFKVLLRIWKTYVVRLIKVEVVKIYYYFNESFNIPQLQ